MTKFTSAALFFLTVGILICVSILSVYQVLFAIPLAHYAFQALKEKSLKLSYGDLFFLAFTAVALLSLVVNFEILPKPAKEFGRIKYFLYSVLGISVSVWLKEMTDKTKNFLITTFFVSIFGDGQYASYEFLTCTDNRAKDLARYGYDLSSGSKAYVK